MTGKECLRQALSLLNYTGEGTTRPGGAAHRHALTYLNQIAAQLWYAENDAPYVPLLSLDETVPLSVQAVQTVLPFGLAMLIAAAAGDTERQTWFSDLYDGRRTALCRTVTTVQDRLPEVSE